MRQTKVAVAEAVGQCRLLQLRVGGRVTVAPPAPGRRPGDDGSSCFGSAVWRQVLLLRVGDRAMTSSPARAAAGALVSPPARVSGGSGQWASAARWCVCEWFFCLEQLDSSARWQFHHK
jgi:hypothetical protein